DVQNLTFRCRGEDTLTADTGAHGHDTAPQSFNGHVPVCSVFAYKKRGVGALFAQPGVWAAESHGEINGPAAVFRDSRSESAISWRRNILPMFPAIRAAIGALTAGGDNESLGLGAR